MDSRFMNAYRPDATPGVDRHRGKRVEHYKSGIRVSHGTVPGQLPG